MLVGSRGNAHGRRPQTAKLHAQYFLRTEKGVKNAAAFFRGSEQDRFPLFTVYVKYTLKMFRWNIFNASILSFNAGRSAVAATAAF